ncbi:MAG: M13 family metallopeptidase [Muribaculaceae bacterium]|nr:M13 family metallopeptidase [Muribaculaceae bacterium]
MRIRSFLFSGLLLSMALGMGAQEHLKSLNGKGLNPDVKPGEDFYLYVNQDWMNNHPLTPEYSRYGQFNVLNDSSNNRVQRIVTNLSKKNPEKGTNAFLIATLYEAGMDSVKRNQLGSAPIQADLARIENATAEEMMDLLLWLHANYASPLFSAGHSEDMANSAQYAMYASGPGLGLGDRDYYLKDDKRNKDVREAYERLIETQMINSGYSKKDAKRIVKNVMKIERLIADSTLTREERRNILAMYNPRTIEQIKTQYPDIPWDRYFAETMGIPTPEVIIVTTPKTLQQGNNLMTSLTDREKKDYYLWNYVRGAAPYLSDNFTTANFEFNKVMSGVQEQQPRWKRALGVTERHLGEAVGELYVEEYFPESSKIYMQVLVENLRKALGKHIINLPWMTDDTKVEAMKKLNSFTVKIGYPDKWEDYSELVLDPNLSYWENVHLADMWAQKKYLEKWGKPVDRTEWGMTPQTINAYYNPQNNEIVFPAGILQAPFYDPEASDAENYGGIGVVIGHELTHGFDDQGSQFDFEGNMVNWWTPEDKAAFDALTQGLADQYSAVEVLPGLFANGQYTLGENIADQGGLRIAYTAFLDSQKKKGVDVNSEEAKIDGLDPAQVFYLNFANLWANNIRDEEIRSLTTSDVHSLGKNRVNVSVRNLQPFFDAFGIVEGDAMYRPESERVIIW